MAYLWQDNGYEFKFYIKLYVSKVKEFNKNGFREIKIESLPEGGTHLIFVCGSALGHCGPIPLLIYEIAKSIPLKIHKFTLKIM